MVKAASKAIHALAHTSQDALTNAPEIIQKTREKVDDYTQEALERALEAAETGGEKAKEVKKALDMAWTSAVDGIKEVAERPEAKRAWYRTKAKGEKTLHPTPYSLLPTPLSLGLFRHVPALPSSLPTLAHDDWFCTDADILPLCFCSGRHCQGKRERCRGAGQQGAVGHIVQDAVGVTRGT